MPLIATIPAFKSARIVNLNRPSSQRCAVFLEDPWNRTQYARVVLTKRKKSPTSSKMASR